MSLKTHIVCIFAFTLWAFVGLAQSATPIAAAGSGVRLAKLAPIAYPPIALIARVSGRVELILTINPSGNVDSTVVVDGPAMLRQTAVASAKENEYICMGCGEASTKLRLIYSFELGEAIYCGNADRSYPRVTQAANMITVIAQPFATCDPMSTISRVRSRAPKCFYLWKCGWRRLSDE